MERSKKRVYAFEKEEEKSQNKLPSLEKSSEHAKKKSLEFLIRSPHQSKKNSVGSVDKSTVLNTRVTDESSELVQEKKTERSFKVKKKPPKTPSKQPLWQEISRAQLLFPSEMSEYEQSEGFWENRNSFIVTKKGEGVPVEHECLLKVYGKINLNFE